ncbi:arsenical resistance protein ArsH [Exophiala spinifera]|uniref:Arsenical resistance protein ArsH n=1 Tax=Exophiala spinifera TaxID=91928 RepID=A0A0D2AWR8_9EURO|nr:arsenical resistance protein ArsH [Exophiala spinifera]KIW11143.1 arsenical resistance protein ArsH [Exophiala spinifera]
MKMAVDAEHQHPPFCAEVQNQRIPPIPSKPEQPLTNGDLNNTASVRITSKPERHPDFAYRFLSISADMDEPTIRSKYRPFLLPDTVQLQDWISRLELATVTELVYNDLRVTGERIKVLILYGSLRQREDNLSYSKLLAFEVARILWRLGCDVRVYNPQGSPVKDDDQHNHPKVQELRDLSRWSDGHFWVSPEQHGNLTAVFKNQIDWIPLSTGSVRPTQGRTLGLAMVSGGSQSFNTVNSLRVLGRWMRMFTIPNQSSVPQAYTLFTDKDEDEGGSRLMPGGNRDRLFDCAEEFVKYTVIMRPHFALFSDRFSEREPLVIN